MFIKLFRSGSSIIFGALLGTFFGDTIWRDSLEKLGLCPAQNIDCSTSMYWQVFIIFFIIIGIVEIINLLVSKVSKNRMLVLDKHKHDNAVASIEVYNNSNEIIENCFAKVNKVYLTIDGNCQRIIDENINDKRIRWDDGTVEVKIYRKSSDVLDIMRAYSENLTLLLHSSPNLSMFVYRDSKNGENARRAKYQLEIEICGTITKDGNNIPIPPSISFWEIFYQSNGKGSNPKISIQRIKSMMEPTQSDITRKQMPNVIEFSVILPFEKQKNG